MAGNPNPKNTEKRPPQDYPRFAEVIVPGGFSELLTYGVPADTSLQRGSLALVSLGNRKEASLALVIRMHTNAPEFPLKPAQPHPTGYCFEESFVETVEWCAKFYCCPLPQSLDTFWPSDLAKLLEVPVRRQKSFLHQVTTVSLPPELTPAQQSACESLLPLLRGSGFRGALLHGITGSGKTRVYLELVQHCLAMGRNALILVPEIALTPQTRDRFQAHLETEVILLHSNLSAPERRHSWQALLRGTARVVLGTRSAILSPGLNPGLILLDEEHDASYKQQDPAPRYHCRELAFHLAHRQGALVILGSATPSLETWEYAERGHLKLVQLRERARPVPLPHVQIIDLRKHSKQDHSLLLSPPLREALADTLAAGQQAIILHNRRGYSTSRICANCGETLECSHCKVAVVEHRQHKGLLCHYCGRLYPLRIPCPKCQGTEFVFAGGAIEKVEEEILAWIPGAQVIRLDRDRVQNIGAAEKILQDFRDGKANILLGTQMVAKGHDFPNVQLVGIVSADIGATLPDFRASERTFQLLTQVAGRAGRNTSGGRVLLQTYNPQDPVLRFALAHDFEGFAKWELQNRKELGYPPFQRMLVIECSGKSQDQVQNAMNDMAQSACQAPEITILGPCEAYIPIINGNYRMHLVLKGQTPLQLRNAAEKATAPWSTGMRNSIQIRKDMDPQTLL